MKFYKIQKRIFIEKNEGFRRRVYTDTAMSHNPTIGMGFNMNQVNALKEWKIAFDSVIQPNFYDVKIGKTE
ncbi:MAG: hypothetical protein MRQ07_04770 [Candidatus Midichloria sp.]|nr:hypothetical protein [Candidatus Midichloria sp.]